MSVQVSYKKQFTAMALLLIIILASIEGLARIYSEITDLEDPRCNIVTNEVYKDEDRDLKQQLCLEWKKLRWQMDPIANVAVPKPNQHFSMININSDSFRGPEIIKEKPSDVYRIFVVGGSTTFAVRAFGDHQTIPGFLQELFNQSNLNMKVEVINAGFSAATSTSESKLIENKIVNYEPDLIIIYDGGNDIFYEPGYMLVVGKSSNQKVETQTNSINHTNEINNIEEEKDISNIEINFEEEFKRFVDEHYKTAHVFNKIGDNYQKSLENQFNFDLKNKEIDIEKIKTRNKFDENLVAKKVEIWENNLSRICTLGNEKKFQTMIVLQPFLGTGNKDLTNHEKLVGYSWWNFTQAASSYQLFANELDELNKVCSKTTDLRNIFDDVEESVYFDHIHIHYDHNKIIAEKLFKSILNDFLLDGV